MAEGTIDKAALWDRLRHDPEVLANLREEKQTVANVLGRRPSSKKAALWGDGQRKYERDHVIADISFESPRSIICICGESVIADGLDIEQAWALHQGKAIPAPSVYRAGQLATDDEVHAFFDLISDPDWEPDLRRYIPVEFRP